MWCIIFGSPGVCFDSKPEKLLALSEHGLGSKKPPPHIRYGNPKHSRHLLLYKRKSFLHGAIFMDAAHAASTIKSNVNHLVNGHRIVAERAHAFLLQEAGESGIGSAAAHGLPPSVGVVFLGAQLNTGGLDEETAVAD
jgi:hypothetical protein